MRWIAVGGQARKVGKTALVEALLRRLGSWEWSAAKITQDDHGWTDEEKQSDRAAEKGKGAPLGESSPREFSLTEESDAGGETDTARFLAAGARRAFWLQVREGCLPAAFLRLLQELEKSPYAVVESNSVVELQRPDLYLMVVDPSVEDLKESARRYLHLADALVLSGENAATADGESFLKEKPVFRFSLHEPLSERLVRFTVERLSGSAAPSTAVSRRLRSR